MSAREYAAPFGQVDPDAGLAPVLQAGVPIVHPNFLGMQTRGKRGTLRTSNPSEELVRIKGNVAEAPESIAVQIDVKSTEDAPDERVRLEVTWGNNGLHTAFVDAVNGCSFSVVATDLYVRAVLEAGTGPIEVTASAAPGLLAGGGPGPTRTLFRTAPLAPTTLATELIPAYAKSFKLYRLPSSELIRVETLGVGPLTETFVAPFAEPPEIWIPNGAFRVRVRHDGLIDPGITWSTIYSLALGGGR